MDLPARRTAKDVKTSVGVRAARGARAPEQMKEPLALSVKDLTTVVERKDVEWPVEDAAAL